MERFTQTWVLVITVAIFLHRLQCTAGHTIYLTSGWTITNGNRSEWKRGVWKQNTSKLTKFCLGIELVNQTIPSGVYSALEEANVTESVMFSYNDVDLRWIANENWTYSLVFSGNQAKPTPEFIEFYIYFWFLFMEQLRKT